MSTKIFTNEYFMKQALAEAKLAFDKNEVPVGCIVVLNNKILARTHNLTELLNDVTAHAEIQAITSATHYMNYKFLDECTMYVTLEPCQMCAGALYWSRLKKLVFAASDPKRGYRTLNTALHPKTQVIQGILEEESLVLLKTFFEKKR